MTALSFRSRARTVDHLGREQIADCPTAVSELWKNSFDAYARRVTLHLFDSHVPVAAVVDDGHGMNSAEFQEKWLIIGTEDKLSNSEVRKADRLGLPLRTRQGQKGIGRLSAAALGSLLLLVSKRKDEPFIASLVDWRLFRNPYLLLDDIRIPFAEFDCLSELPALTRRLFDELMENVWGGDTHDERHDRIVDAWNRFSLQEEAKDSLTTQRRMEETIIETSFDERHFTQWPVWTGDSDCGTALFVADLEFDLLSQLEETATSKHADEASRAKDIFVSTLSSFVDPYDEELLSKLEFETSVIAWHGSKSRMVVAREREFGLSSIEQLEHFVRGTVDENGVFRGRIKAFGEWQEGDVQITLAPNLSSRGAARVGRFDLVLATYERVAANSSLAADLHAQAQKWAENHSGLMVFRDGLRVMPYGRPDTDFFLIEERRSRHAGREFWNHRRMFGRIAIGTDENPNLRDKAGREGLIEGHATKVFRDLVISLLQTTSRRYFGSASDLRDEELSAKKLERAESKARKDAAALERRRRRVLKDDLNEKSEDLGELEQDLEGLQSTAKVDAVASFPKLMDVHERLMRVKKDLEVLAPPTRPRDLRSLEGEYRNYVSRWKSVSEAVSSLEASISNAASGLSEDNRRQIVVSAINHNASALNRRLSRWSEKAISLLQAELEGFGEQVEERKRLFRKAATELIGDERHKRMSVLEVHQELDRIYRRFDQENEEFFESYIFAMEAIKERIDLVGLTAFQGDQVSELSEEIDRLNALAQLGITVEIIGHEIEGLDLTITRNLDGLPKSVADLSPIQTALHAHRQLTERLRFLTPLKLSGNPQFEVITGEAILSYIESFFQDSLARAEIVLEATEAFKSFRVRELPSRIYPVFINLINNARYWLTKTPGDVERKLVCLDVRDGLVLVGDNGPGVDEEDERFLFTLFFSRKSHGGRGVGLYLCRANLRAGGHTIEYVTDERRILPGANFGILFRGGEYVGYKPENSGD